jgi:hypothetical protein
LEINSDLPNHEISHKVQLNVPEMKTSMFTQPLAICSPNGFAMTCAMLLSISSLTMVVAVFADSYEDMPGAAGEPYPKMPAIASLGVRIEKHAPCSACSLQGADY